MPSAEGLVRYGLDELLRGLGLAPEWTHRDSARLGVSTEEGRGDGLWLRITPQALADLATPRLRTSAEAGRVKIDGEAWPVPVGPSGPTDALGDLVAGAAWWLAGLQERAVSERDRHGRFPYARSLQAALGAAPGGPLRPAVDVYRRRLAAALREAGIDVPGRTWDGAPWAVALTHDLDALRTRRLRALVGGLLRGDVRGALRQALGPDRRWTTTEALADLGQRHEAPATWFVKPGQWTPEDLPVDLTARADRLRTLVADGEIGWHPGYGVHDHPARWNAEAERFESAIGTPPRLARTHFLRWSEPETPRALAGRGVRIDSTLGFAEHEGFRRGTCHPFRLYDLDADRPSDLWEVPLAVMDTTLTDYRGLDPEAGAEAIRSIFEAARRRGGIAVVLWHNQIGGDDAAWDRWVDTLDRELGRARDEGARLGPLAGLLSAWQGDANQKRV
ncbi:hypothetical protein BSZ37_10155 [Rubrivirga marina]|uniref:NodB homology domain-containing protein n=1 Tax=Rubrivirga marina TaxID=1196024 RepID=A0A271J088_9BACT|nr:hypothetical protein BSZ37_10155 [Rubrivirga marina]